MPDLAHARLAILRFPQYGEERSLHVTLHEEADLLSYDALDDRVRVVYETWTRISAEKHARTRRSGTGKNNPFDF
jgi:hypothetical protein